VLFSAVSIRSNRRDILVRGDEGEVEYFCVYCPDTGDVYGVPIEDVRGRRGALRVSPTRNAQARRIRWARDYALPDVD
jgi:hypothetical protein